MSLPVTEPWRRVDPEHMTPEDLFVVWNHPEFWESQGFRVAATQWGSLWLEGTEDTGKVLPGDWIYSSVQKTGDPFLYENVLRGIQAGLSFRSAVTAALIARKL